MDVDEYYLHLANSVGALVAVHSPYFTSYDLDKSSIFVAPGTSVSMALNVVGEKRGEPTGDCLCYLRGILGHNISLKIIHLN